MGRKSLLKLVITNLVMIFTLAITTFAGTGVIQFSDPKPTRDKSFNVACKVKSTDVRLKSADITVQYDPKMLEFIEGNNAEGGSGTIRINGTGVGKGSGTRTLEYQLKFKALYAGKTNITILDQEVTDTTDNLVNITKLGSSVVEIRPSNTQSGDANLATLEFSPGELDREFDASVLSYNVEVNADVESLIISAISEDKDATVSISGNENFQVGMNRVTIDVVAPNKTSTKQYVLNVTKLETGVTNGDTTIANGQRLTSNEYSITIMSKPGDVEIPSGYKKLQGEFGGSTIEAYGPTNTPDGVEPEVFLVYATNQDGIIDFYRYDRRNGDNTIQRYVAEANAGEYEKLVKQYDSLVVKNNTAQQRLSIIFPVAIVLLALVLILIIILIVVIIRNGSNKARDRYNFDNVDDDDDDEDDDYFTAKRPTKINTLKDDGKRDSNDDNDIDDEDDNKDEIEDLG